MPSCPPRLPRLPSWSLLLPFAPPGPLRFPYASEERVAARCSLLAHLLADDPQTAFTRIATFSYRHSRLLHHDPTADTWHYRHTFTAPDGTPTHVRTTQRI